MWRVVLLFWFALHSNQAFAGARPPDEGRSQLDPSVTKIDETKYLGQALLGSTRLLDEQGQSFQLSKVFGKPTILVLSYYGCDGTCPTINRNLAAVLKDFSRFKLGKDFSILTVSFDAKDDPKQAQAFLQDSQKDFRSGNGWAFSVLEDRSKESVESFARQVGFNFFWSRADKLFVHPNVLVFLTPQGRVARYIYGTNMDAKNLELALIDADWGRISEGSGTVFDMITGACYSYSYSDGRYQPNYALIIGVASLLFGLSLMALGALGYRRKLARRFANAN